MTVKSLAKGAVALAGAATVAGAVWMGVTSGSPTATTASPQVKPAVFGVPMPLDPAADLPGADQLTVVLNGLADPGVPFRAKGNLVEGGIGILEGRAADAMMRSAVAKGQLPLTFQIADITAEGPGMASAAVTAAGPGMPPYTQNITFVDQGGWKLSRSSASQVLSLFAT